MPRQDISALLQEARASAARGMLGGLDEQVRYSTLDWLRFASNQTASGCAASQR